jgi:hypothetical protein
MPAVMTSVCAYDLCREPRSHKSEFCYWHRKKLRPPKPGRKRHWVDSIEMSDRSDM